MNTILTTRLSILGVLCALLPAMGQEIDAILLQPMGQHECIYLSLATDVPNDQQPGQVWYKKNPGHVFLILERQDSLNGQRAAVSWGFYPRRPIASLFFRKVPAILRDNGAAPYNARIRVKLQPDALQRLQTLLLQPSPPAYHLNRYNCYDYALDVFNTVSGMPLLPRQDVPFPFPMGQGGSPCALYQALVQRSREVLWQPYIQLGMDQAPPSGSHPPFSPILLN